MSVCSGAPQRSWEGITHMSSSLTFGLLLWGKVFSWTWDFYFLSEKPESHTPVTGKLHSKGSSWPLSWSCRCAWDAWLVWVLGSEFCPHDCVKRTVLSHQVIPPAQGNISTGWDFFLDDINAGYNNLGWQLCSWGGWLGFIFPGLSVFKALCWVIHYYCNGPGLLSEVTVPLSASFALSFPPSKYSHILLSTLFQNCELFFH